LTISSCAGSAGKPTFAVVERCEKAVDEWGTSWRTATSAASRLTDQIDLVVAVYDDVVVWIAASPLSVGDDHAQVDSIAADLPP
jgi:hypothetical protein